MKTTSSLAAALLALSLGTAATAHATNLVDNGSFEEPNIGTGYGTFNPTTGVPGWQSNGSGIEIDYSALFGAPAYSGTQSLEVNAYYPENVYQTVTGLIPGETYLLSWAYGDRPDSGDEEMQVYFGGDLVATDYDLLDGSNSALIWTYNSVIVTATSTSELLSFDGLDYVGTNGSYTDNGGPSYGNELDAVSLVAATPEPSTWVLMLSGIGLLAFAVLRKRGSFSFGAM